MVFAEGLSRRGEDRRRQKGPHRLPSFRCAQGDDNKDEVLRREETCRSSGQACPGELAQDPVPGDAIVPVPSTGGRIRTRGYNQTDLLAAQLASLTGAEVRRLLKRRGGATQIGLGAGERTRNIRGAFTAVRARRPGGSIWLLDDVMTTGATMTECASVLEDALDAGVLPAAVCFRKPEDESIIQGKEVYHGGV